MKLNRTSHYGITLVRREGVIEVGGKEFSEDTLKDRERFLRAATPQAELYVCIRRDDNVSVNDSFAREDVNDGIVKSRWTRFAGMVEIS